MRKCNGSGDCFNCSLKDKATGPWDYECDEKIICDKCGKEIDELDDYYGYGNTHYCEECLLKLDEIKKYSHLMNFIISENLFSEYLRWLNIADAVEFGNNINFTADELHKYLIEYVFDNSKKEYFGWFVDNCEV